MVARWQERDPSPPPQSKKNKKKKSKLIFFFVRCHFSPFFYCRLSPARLRFIFTEITSYLPFFSSSIFPFKMLCVCTPHSFQVPSPFLDVCVHERHIHLSNFLFSFFFFLFSFCVGFAVLQNSSISLFFDKTTCCQILKRLEAALQGKQNGWKKDRNSLVFFLSTQLTTTTVLQFNTIFSPFCFPGFERTNKIPDLFCGLGHFTNPSFLRALSTLLFLFGDCVKVL